LSSSGQAGTVTSPPGLLARLSAPPLLYHGALLSDPRFSFPSLRTRTFHFLSCLFDLLSRVSLDPSRVPCTESRCHLRAARLAESDSFIIIIIIIITRMIRFCTLQLVRIRTGSCLWAAEGE
ncbi:hypothetical protein GOODEAATRI_001849, partial [Goodea atripinnis]